MSLLNLDRKNRALEIHQRAVNKYNSTYETLQDSGNRLYKKRKDAIGLIESIEDLVNSISNTPKEFETTLGKIHAERMQFLSTDAYAEEAYKEALKTGVGAAAGIAGGAAVAGWAPNAMLWIATTYGTASTGTAISTLGGAAASKAAAAWIGRTFLPKFMIAGAGMKAGQAVLAMAGPIGWGISGVSVAASTAITGRKNRKIADEAIEEAKEITAAGAQIHEATAKIDQLFEETKLLQKKLSHQFDSCRDLHSTDFLNLTEEQQLLLGTLVNNTLTLSELLNKTIE